MERDKDEMQRLTEMLNDPNAEFQDDDEEAMEEDEEDPNLIQNEVEIEATKESEKMEE